MPSAKKNDVHNKSIKDFFKPFTIPKSRIPANDIIEEEIIVTQPSFSPARGISKRESSQSPRRRQDGVKSPQSSQISSTILSIRSTLTKRSTPDTLTHVSPAGSQRRIMTAVEIPPPKPSEPKVEEAPSAILNTSFSTISTLSSVPISTASSSRRITTKSGIQGITNSDSGSAESSSEDELADMSTFIPRKRLRLTPPEKEEHVHDAPSTVKPTNKRNGRSSRSTEQLRATNASGRASPSLTAPSYKYSLAALVKQQQKDQDVAKRMMEMEDKSTAKANERQTPSQVDRSALSGMHAAVVDDSDEGERVMLAMQRTGALDGDEKFYYFGGLRDDVIDETFPIAKDGDPPWIEKLRDKRWRTQACLSGFAAELAHRDGLPPDVQLWLARQLRHEKREDLCEAYTSILESDRPFSEVTYMMSPLRAYYNIGPAVQKENVTPESPPHALKYVLRIAQHYKTAAYTGKNPRSETLMHLTFGMVDANIEQDLSLKCAIEDCFESILGQGVDHETQSLSEELESRLLSSKSSSKFSTRIKCRAIAAMPARSEPSNAIRRQLALRLVLDHLESSTADDYSILPSTSQSNADRLLRRLKSAPEFAISERTDYSLLNPLIQVLDIAIGSGFSEPHEDGGSSNDVTKHFNAKIDEFIDQLNVMASRIRDAGTTHLGRTQAKSAIERLVKRLEYGVRTKPRVRKGVFSSGLVADEGQKRFLESFLKAADAKPGALNTVIDENAILKYAVES